MRLLRLVLVFVAVAFAACAGPAPTDVIPVPTSAPTGLFGPSACPAALLEGELVADDEAPRPESRTGREGHAEGQPSMTRVPVMSGWSEQSKKYSPASRAGRS